jgi:hypothetical protein
MKLYVANVSRFRALFQYRPQPSTLTAGVEVRRGGVRQLTLLPKQCIALPEMDQNEVMFVVDQAKLSGALLVEDVRKAPKQPAVFLLSIDSPVGPSIMNDLHANNMVVKTREGEERRRLAAVGVNKIVETHIEQVKTVDVEMEQMAPFIDPTKESDGPELKEGFHVSRDAPVAPAPQRGGRRNRR